jgi:hypothetical protein
MELWKSCSAPGVFFSSLSPLVAAGLARGSAGTCPTLTMAGTTATYQGGCTDPDGNTWVGKATSTNAAQSTMSGDVSYQGFGFTGSNGAATTYDGTITATGTNETTDYAIDLVFTGTGSGSSNTGGISYSATVVRAGSGSAQTKTWNGTGEIGYASLGKVRATTEDEVIQDSACSHKPLSGTTTIVAGPDTAVITYNGAGSCDQDATAPWTLDGAPQDALTRVSCNAGGAPGATAGVVVAIALARRRRRAPR